MMGLLLHEVLGSRRLILVYGEGKHWRMDGIIPARSVVPGLQSGA